MNQKESKSKLADQLIIDLISDPSKFKETGKSNELLKHFLRGYPLEKLRSLFYSQAEEVIAIAIWIASELGGDGSAFVDDAIVLLQSQNRRIRYYALDVVMLATANENPKSFFHIVKHIEDKDISVRQRALELLSRATDKQLNSALEWFREEEPNSSHIDMLRRLLGSQTISAQEVIEMLQHRNALYIKYGLAIAERKFHSHPKLLEAAASLNDPENVSVAKYLLMLHQS